MKKELRQKLEMRRLDIKANAVNAINNENWFHAEQCLDELRRIDERLGEVQHGPLCRRCFDTDTVLDRDMGVFWCRTCDDYALMAVVETEPMRDVEPPVYATMNDYFEENPREKEWSEK